MVVKNVDRIQVAVPDAFDLVNWLRGITGNCEGWYISGGLIMPRLYDVVFTNHFPADKLDKVKLLIKLTWPEQL